MIYIYDAVPLWLIILGGYLETIVILWFICNVCNIQIGFPRLALMAACSLAVIIFIKSILQSNIFAIVMAGIVFNYLFIWLFTGTGGRRVLYAVILSYGIISLIEPLSYFIISSNGALLNQNLAWFLTGMPHITFFVLITLVIRKVRSLHEQ